MYLLNLEAAAVVDLFVEFSMVILCYLNNLVHSDHLVPNKAREFNAQLCVVFLEAQPPETALGVRFVWVRYGQQCWHSSVINQCRYAS